MRAIYLMWFALFGCVPAASAHPLLQDAMWVQFEPRQVHVAVNVSLREISVAQHSADGATGISDSRAWERMAEQHREYILKHLTLSAGTNVLTGRVIKRTPPPFVAGPEQTFYQYELIYPLNGPPPAEITIQNNMLQDRSYAAGTAWDLSYVVRARRADTGDVTTWLLGCRQPATIPTGWGNPAIPAKPAPSATTWRIGGEYLRHGILHILTGYDHLLFICALVIATRSFWEMVKVIAAFTLAHTITLALCVFGIFRLPSCFVEPVIALSIVFVALENFIWPQRAGSRIRLAVAFGFGLIHGLGFAGGLLDAMAGLPPIGTWIALGAFSLGVELGHQTVVLPLFGALALSRARLSTGCHPAVLRYGSAAISVCGACYLVTALQQQLFSH